MDVIRADNPAFGSAGMALVRDWHFNVPSDWSTDGGPARRFHLQVMFVIDGMPAPKPWYPNVMTFPIEGKVR